MLFFIPFFILSFFSVATQAQTVSECFNLLPEKLPTEKEAPLSTQFVSSKNLIDFEKQIGGKGWGYALKYSNNYCEVIIYSYTRNKKTINESDVMDELTYFDGFTPLGKFQKEVGYDVFHGLSGQAKLSDNTPEQTQIVAITKVGDSFVKYRASCRYLEGFDEEENFKLADAFLTQAMKGSFGQLAFCLRGNKLSD